MMRIRHSKFFSVALRNHCRDQFLQQQQYHIQRRLATRVLEPGPSLQDFLNKVDTSTIEIKSSNSEIRPVFRPLEPHFPNGNGLTYFIETYGCQMNVSDSEIVRSVLYDNGHSPASNVEEADLVLLNTCAIRDNAEAKIWNRLSYFQSLRRDNRTKQPNDKTEKARPAELSSSYHPPSIPENKLAGRKTNSRPTKPFVGVLGCMAERLKDRLLDEESVDFVVGPDSYR